jgi:hypothetical protein
MGGVCKMDENVNQLPMFLDKDWFESKVEPMARILAAEKMGLPDDNYGENLPDDLWQQCIPEARKFFGI